MCAPVFWIAHFVPVSWVTLLAPFALVTHFALDLSACHVQALHLGPTVSVPAAAVVAAGPGSSEFGVGYGLYPVDLYPPGTLQVLVLGSTRSCKY